jgi:hypothetical protein
MELLINIGRGRCTLDAAGNTTWEDWRDRWTGRVPGALLYVPIRVQPACVVLRLCRLVPMILISFDAAGDGRQCVILRRPAVLWIGR